MDNVADLGPVWELSEAHAGYSDIEGRLVDVNLRINTGERVALLGRENAGRSLLLRVLAGLRPVKVGRYSVFGDELALLPFYKDWDELVPVHLRRKMGICLEREGLLSNVSIREGLELLFRYKYGDHTEELRKGSVKVVSELCQRFGIESAIDKRPSHLGSAERRLAGLARAFLSKPSAILLENPSQDIGDSSRGRLWAAMEEIASAPERTLVISTDDWALARQLCRRWIVVDQGKIVFDGPQVEFLQSSDPLAALIRGRALSERAERKAA